MILSTASSAQHIAPQQSFGQEPEARNAAEIYWPIVRRKTFQRIAFPYGGPPRVTPLVIQQDGRTMRRKRLTSAGAALPRMVSMRLEAAGHRQEASLVGWLTDTGQGKIGL
jgi:hypothetical protein